ncbi:amino acid ABC transporter permease [Cucumibacter marinus]|uniref:amino acid ABC transporter permease n=1 Tax=Cucumibacter marinus TaxID=1121252 RepID=UPI00068726AC|nr:amino acid ABC transporter permease [Cucumibacter marinus]
MPDATPQPEAYRPRKQRRPLPWWLLATALLGLLGLWAITVDADYALIFRALSGGIGTTLFVTAVAFTLAVLLGAIVALARNSKLEPVRQVAIFYTEIVRGVPMLVLLFYIAFVGAPAIVEGVNWVLTPLRELGLIGKLTVRQFDFTWRAIIALTISYSAFIAEIFRAGIQSVDQGHVEAARALGLSRWHTFRFVIAPQAARTVLPPLGNELVAMIKDSALVSALGVQDITQLGKVYSASTFKFFETYNIVAYLYLVLTITLSLAVRWLESVLGKADRVRNQH